MASDFYTTMAQVFPLLLLALIWNSSFLDRLRGQRRLPRRLDPNGVWFWTKPRVRVYTIFVGTIVIVLSGICVFELAGFIPNSFTLKVVMSCGLVLVLGTLLTRIWFDVIAATSTAAEYRGDGQGQGPAGTGSQVLADGHPGEVREAAEET